VGTVVADDANQSQAVIESSKNREQKAFREGDQIGKVRIKKIQRNKVIITTQQGDRLLTIDPERVAKNDRASSFPQSTKSSPLEQDAGGQSQIPSSQFSVQREFVTRFLGDPDEFLQNMEISPYTEDDRPAGFQITGITPNNPLGKMGLIDGDVIMAINQETITSPQQAPDFLRKLIKGGKIKIRVKRDRSRRLVRLNIN
jgi:general secretion pathway protein C